MTKRILLATSLALYAAAACSSKIAIDSSTDAGTSDASAIARVDASEETDASVALTPGMMVGILSTMSTGEVEQASAALQKGLDPDVRAFATRTTNEHLSRTRDLRTLEHEAFLEPEGSALRTELVTMNAIAKDRLAKVTGTALDQAYLDVQVTALTQMLRIIDSVLLRHAQLEPLIELLQNARPMVAADLNTVIELHARQQDGGAGEERGSAGPHADAGPDSGT